MIAGKLLHRLEGHFQPRSSFIFSPDGKRIAAVTSTGHNGEVKVWDAATGRALLSLKAEGEGNPLGTRLWFGPDGHRLKLQYSQGQVSLDQLRTWTWDAAG